ncbi:uncharacterized protein LOC114247091 isoform X3 [Bombyx mandarina]|uniref:Integral membrane protein 2 n=2 Tax=Bombyx TaxID=7090 RepID=A0A8R2AKC0_BOMMO|nr:uncharacterized protein LOC101739397 isoform X2 [Bombyx mori]XP_028035735.1 uncharacterized protein LOC114247091 isoform X3 [Bombyx mandarina]
MTVFTKPSLNAHKPEAIADQLCEDELIDMHNIEGPYIMRKRSATMLVCMFLMALVVAATSIAGGVLLYRQYVRIGTVRRYQGFCTIPISTRDSQLMEPNFRTMPLRWSNEPDVQIVSTLDEAATDQLITALREELDIGETVEKISVIDNGRRIHFIHDFQTNTTGIIDSDRCFTMELQPELVLLPGMLASGLQRGDAFDVTRVRSSLRALLPALTDLPDGGLLLDDCNQKPVYRLEKDDQPMIRKRSVDALSHDYIHFSGRHVQEIEISNLAQLLQQEQKANQP